MGIGFREKAKKIGYATRSGTRNNIEVS